MRYGCCGRNGCRCGPVRDWLQEEYFHERWYSFSNYDIVVSIIIFVLCSTADICFELNVWSSDEWFKKALYSSLLITFCTTLLSSAFYYPPIARRPGKDITTVRLIAIEVASAIITLALSLGIELLAERYIKHKNIEKSLLGTSIFSATKSVARLATHFFFVQRRPITHNNGNLATEVTPLKATSIIGADPLAENLLLKPVN